MAIVAYSFLECTDKVSVDLYHNIMLHHHVTGCANDLILAWHQHRISVGNVWRAVPWDYQGTPTVEWVTWLL
jgi:hypothetical protein